LDAAIALTSFSGRIVIGSWYGEKRAPVDLGSIFHRSRIKLISSQVSTIAPELSARWDKTRRFAVAWEASGASTPGNGSPTATLSPGPLKPTASSMNLPQKPSRWCSNTEPVVFIDQSWLPAFICGLIPLHELPLR
jgi:hypothetical protein